MRALTARVDTGTSVRDFKDTAYPTNPDTSFLERVVVLRVVV